IYIRFLYTGQFIGRFFNCLYTRCTSHPFYIKCFCCHSFSSPFFIIWFSFIFYSVFYLCFSLFLHILIFYDILVFLCSVIILTITLSSKTCAGEYFNRIFLHHLKYFFTSIYILYTQSYY